ncbi:hypothetical protein KC357_g7953 [Hortaea werneckii]|nr:hypothetical protein KC357_g7953 [Hortaea werneckii]
MNQRRDAIEQAYKNTFQWIFEEPREDKWNISRTWQWLTSSRKRPTNTIFTTWLRNETGIFWINGKPGAGKSTLMKFMVEDPRLAMHARVWAGSHKLSISSFYFWKHGSKLQKSLCGLYRAILFQMLVRDPQLALAAFPEWQTSFSSEDPLLETLRAALMRIAKADALRGTSRTKYLILIDGLDEFEDEGSDDIFLSQERFSADLRQISENDAVKIVVASRPERVYESNFSHGRHLAVHKLTAQDLKYFVHDSLINDKSTRPSGETYSTEEIELLNLLVRDIVEKSQGVSLWTRIVTNMIRVHMHKNRSLDLLQGLVEKLDTHLLNLFDQIMARILQLDEEKTEGLRYLALTFHWSSTVGSESAATGLMVPPDPLQVSVLGIGCKVGGRTVTRPWLKNNIQSLTDIGRDQSRIEGRIKSFCLGLLETDTHDLGVRGRHASLFKDICSATFGKATYSQDLGSTPIRKVIRPIHRTLFEYLSNHDALQITTTLSSSTTESFDVNTGVLVGLVATDDRSVQGINYMYRNLWLFLPMAQDLSAAVQISILSAFDQAMRIGFAALVKKSCRFDHDHKITCMSSHTYLQQRDKMRGLMMSDVGPLGNQYYIMCDTGGFTELTELHHILLQFASNPRHPLASSDAGFLNILALAIVHESNTFVTHFINGSISIGSLTRETLAVEDAMRLLNYALYKCRDYPTNYFGTYLEHLTNFQDQIQPNVKALESLLPIGGLPGGVCALEGFLDIMPQRTLDYVQEERRGRDQSYYNVGLGFTALNCLIAYAAVQKVYRPWVADLTRWQSTKLKVFEFRGYSIAQILRQVARILRHHDRLCKDDRWDSRITAIMEIQSLLEEADVSSTLNRSCYWSGFGKLTQGFAELTTNDNWRVMTDTLTAACEAGLDIAKDQALDIIPLDQDENLCERITGATWLSHSSRKMKDIEGKMVSLRVGDRTLRVRGQSEHYDIVGWLVLSQKGTHEPEIMDAEISQLDMDAERHREVVAPVLDFKGNVIGWL